MAQFTNECHLWWTWASDDTLHVTANAIIIDPNEEECEFNAEFSVLRTSTYIHLVKNRKKTFQPEQIYYPELDVCELNYNTDVLKSSLQKCIRRGLVDHTEATASQMARQNLDDLLRRIPIIQVEDLCTLDSFPFLVWIMAAHGKGYKLSLTMMTHVITLIKEMAIFTNEEVIKQRRPYTNRPFEWMSSDCFWFCRYVINKKMDNNSSNMAIAFATRICYGGTTGDMELIHNAGVWLLWSQEQENCKPWKDTINNNVKFYSCMMTNNNNSTNINILNRAHIISCESGFKGLAKFEPKHKLAEAVDFHCSRVIDKIMIRKDIKEMGLTKVDIRNMVWNYRSNINIRFPLSKDEEIPEEWSEIVPVINALSWQEWKPINKLPIATSTSSQNRYILNSTSTSTSISSSSSSSPSSSPSQSTFSSISTSSSLSSSSSSSTRPMLSTSNFTKREQGLVKNEK